MKPSSLSLLLGCWLALAATVSAQSSTPAAQPEPSRYSSAQLEELLGPIALYPDALVALILPASTVASDVVLASRYLVAHPGATSLDQQSWDESVRALARYPAVVKWMDENLEWTREVGAAFVAQPTDVMNAIQRLRARARAAGTLTDTPQQHVAIEGNDIAIVPAQPNLIFVPRYDPTVVYRVRHHQQPSTLFTFSAGFATGSWLYYDCDWSRRIIWVGHPHQTWRHHHRNWHQRHFPGRPGYVHDPRWRHWQPPAHAVRPAHPRQHWTHIHAQRPPPARAQAKSFRQSAPPRRRVALPRHAVVNSSAPQITRGPYAHRRARDTDRECNRADVRSCARSPNRAASRDPH